MTLLMELRVLLSGLPPDAASDQQPLDRILSTTEALLLGRMQPEYPQVTRSSHVHLHARQGQEGHTNTIVIAAFK